MSQYFPSKAKIGALSESGGTITLSDSHVKIGGQGFDTGELTLLVGTATANELYMIYAVRDSGSTILVKSTNYNSVGPAGYDSWKLVGAFYTAAADTFGSFVNIEGAPQSEWTAFTPGSTIDTNVEHTGFWRRVGDEMEMQFRADFSGVPNSASFVWDIPSGYAIGTSKIPGTPGDDTILGNAIIVDSGAQTCPGILFYEDTNSVRIGIYQVNSSDIDYTSWNPTTSPPFGAGNGDSATGICKVPMDEWNNKPLKDL